MFGGQKSGNMAKASKPYKQSNSKVNKLKEPIAMPYAPVRRLVTVADFPYSKFAKITAKVPFTQKEWANILHLSEKTLQRYSKDNKSFEGIYVDRILQLEQLIEMGLETFTDADTLYRWLKREKKVLGHTLNFESLYSTQGIQDVIDEIGRIQYGVYI
jgi:putative toxin-antitoxin system antitoxin component (TIGR02293 family)